MSSFFQCEGYLSDPKPPDFFLLIQEANCLRFWSGRFLSGLPCQDPTKWLPIFSCTTEMHMSVWHEVTWILQKRVSASTNFNELKISKCPEYTGGFRDIPRQEISGRSHDSPSMVQSTVKLKISLHIYNHIIHPQQRHFFAAWHLFMPTTEFSLTPGQHRFKDNKEVPGSKKVWWKCVCASACILTYFGPMNYYSEILDTRLGWH